MKRSHLYTMSTDQLWAVHQEITAMLAKKIALEKSVLQDRLRQLNQGRYVKRAQRRPYPTVFPKYQNPDDPTQTWAGRGKQPRWLTAQLRSGKRIDEFRMQVAAE